MLVAVIDEDDRKYRCELGEFSQIPDVLPSGPPPAIVAISVWSGADPRVVRRNVDGQEYADLTHEE